MAGATFQLLLSGTTASNIGVPVSLGTNGALSSTSTNVLTTVATVPAGGLIFVTACFVKASSIVISSITDSNGNTYAAAVSAGYNVTNLDNQELWYAVSAAPLTSGSTITVTLNGLSSNPWPMCAGYSTGLTATPIDKVNSTKYEPASGTLSSGTTGVLTQAKELIVGATGFYTSTTFTEGAGFTQLNDLDAGGANHLRSHLAYQIVNATTAVNYQPSSTASIFGGSMIATFKGT